jgi:hypothetical protein
MTGSVLTPLVLGHNAFFGVDHLSAARGEERSRHFSDPGNILSMVRHAHGLGARGMMLSTHDRAAPVADLVRRDKVLSQDMRLYPLLPYITKYITQANEKGMLNVVLDALGGSGVMDKLGMLWRGGLGVLTKDVFGVLSALIQLELKPFRGLDMPAVFLHDTLTDLALALGLKDIFAFYLDEMAKRWNCQGAFATKNLPLCLERFQEWGFPPPVLMTHVNKTGFMMNPSREACEAAARRYPVSILAMGTLASGFLKPDEAYAYLATVSGIDGVVVGVSSAAHAEETFSALRRHKAVRAWRENSAAGTGPASSK